MLYFIGENGDFGFRGPIGIKGYSGQKGSVTNYYYQLKILCKNIMNSCIEVPIKNST